MMRWMLWMALSVGGCASHEVRCDMHLQAINSPAPRRSAGELPEADAARLPQADAAPARSSK